MPVVVVCALAFAACGHARSQTVATKSVQHAPSLSEGVSETSATESTATSSTIVPTTVASPTTAAPPTTMPAFSVRSIDVTVGLCRHGYPPQGASGANYGCVGSFVVHLNPGVGGTLGWTSVWHMYAACDSPYPPSDRTTSGTLEVPTGATEVSGKLAIFSESEYNPQLVLGRPAANTSTVKVVVTSGSVAQSPPTPVYDDGDCSVAGQYNSPSYGTSVPYP